MNKTNININNETNLFFKLFVAQTLDVLLLSSVLLKVFLDLFSSTDLILLT